MPIVRQVTDLLRDRVQTGVWPAGQRLPSEADLAHELGVGKDTLRDALAILFNEGVLWRGGRGQRAMVPPAVKREHVILPPRSALTVRMPTPTERTVHGIPEGVPVAEVRYDGTTRIFRGDQYDFRPH